MAEVVDPAAAQVSFERWSVLRPLRLVDVRRSLPDSLLPVIRYGQHGLREVRGEDRIRARLVDAFLLLVLSLTVVPRFTQTLGGLLFGFVLLWFLLEVPSSALTGRTLGKFILGLRVVRIEDGNARLGLARATARWLLRIVNGFIGSPASQAMKGDTLGRVAPTLSLFDGIGAATLVLPEAEFRWLTSQPPAVRERALRETVFAIRALPDTVSARGAWISTTIVAVIVLATIVGLLGMAVGAGAA